MKLAGLELIKFKIHELENEEILDLTHDLLLNVRETLVIATIKILQRKDGPTICEKLAEIAENGTDNAAHAALMGLGSIGTKDSYECLSSLIEVLPNSSRRKQAVKQIENQ